MITHHIVGGTNRFRSCCSIYFLLNYGEETIRELQEHGNGSFLQVQIQHMMLSAALVYRVARPQRVSRAVLVLSSRRPSTLRRLGGAHGWSILCYLIDVNVEFEELLADKVLNESVIVHKFLVVNLCAALQLHFLRIKLPLYLDLDEGETHEPQHFFSFSLEFEAYVEGAWLKHLLVQLHLIVSVLRKRILSVNTSLSLLVARIIQPNLTLHLHALWLRGIVELLYRVVL